MDLILNLSNAFIYRYSILVWRLKHFIIHVVVITPTSIKLNVDTIFTLLTLLVTHPENMSD